MAEETTEERARRAEKILNILEQTHPEATIYLDYDGPWQLLIATILAAQCTDEKVNEITPDLFSRWPSPQQLADAAKEEVQELIRPTGTFRRKQEAIQRVSRVIVEEYGGEVPEDMDALTQIKGVGRKTAAIVIGQALGGQAIGADTHVLCVSKRLGIVTTKTANAVMNELEQIIPEECWTRATELLTTHGRRVCTARNPDHVSCSVRDLCDFYLNEVAGD